MLTLLQGDALEKLQTLESKSVQCCVTSPPYWGLRDYGATSQLSLEPTPEAYIANMVAVFRKVARVLRDDGTLWLNMGDSYAGGKQGCDDGGYNGNGSFHGQPKHDETKPIQRKPPLGLKPKDLCGIPWRLAFALQADGWYLRSDIIWHKPNPMPESVTDRPTKAHEYIFLLTKSERYFYDAEAIREPGSSNTNLKVSKSEVERIANARINGNTSSAGKFPEPKTIPYDGLTKNNESFSAAVCLPVENRNKRSVWTIATQPYADAHFATFPEELPKLCILAGSKLGDTVLDPFAGSGTTGQVAIELGRKAILIELNPDYCDMIRVRCMTTIGLPFTRSSHLTGAKSPAQPIQMLLRF
jgi:DNA modification methylase